MGELGYRTAEQIRDSKRRQVVYPNIIHNRPTSNKGTGLREIVIYEPQEILAMFDAIKTNSWHSKRNRALLAIISRGLLRINECLELMPTDVSLSMGEVIINKGKRTQRQGNERTIGIDIKTAMYLDEWLKKRNETGYIDEFPLFCAHTGAKSNWVTVRNTFKGIARRAGITKAFRFHCLRHSGAHWMYTEGLSLYTLQVMLGHKSPAHTAHYLQRICPRDAIKDVKARIW